MALAPVKQQIDIVTKLPGPKSLALQRLSEDYEPATFAHGQVPFGFRRGDGVFVEDVDGNTFLDFTSGVLVANIGHGRKTVMDRIAQMARDQEITNSYNYLNPYRPALARLLMETIPDTCADLKTGKAFILTTGSRRWSGRCPWPSGTRGRRGIRRRTGSSRSRGRSTGGRRAPGTPGGSPG